MGIIFSLLGIALTALAAIYARRALSPVVDLRLNFFFLDANLVRLSLEIENTSSISLYTQPIRFRVQEHDPVTGLCLYDAVAVGQVG